MRIAWGALVLLFVGTVAEAKGKKLGPKMLALGQSMEGGRSWKGAVDRAVAELGPPQDKADSKYLWYSLDEPKTCFMFMLRAEGEFVAEIAARRVDYLGTKDVDPKEVELWTVCTRGAKLRPLAKPKIRPFLGYELTTPTKAVLEALHGGNYKLLWEMSAPKLQDEIVSADGWKRWAALFESVAGKAGAPNGKFSYAVSDFKRKVSGNVEFEKGTLTFETSWVIVEGKPKLRDITLNLPKDLQRPPDPADAPKVARKAVDLVLAGKMDELTDMMSSDLIAEIAAKPDIGKQLQTTLQDKGKVKSIKLAEQTTCGGRQCVKYDLTTTKGAAWINVELGYMISTWQVAAFQIGP